MHCASPSRFILGGLAALLGLLSISQAPAATTALIMEGTSDVNPIPEGGDGYWFSVVDSYISVTALGYFDFEGDGLIAPHDVGIWDSDGNLLGSAVVPGGVVAALEDQFRWIPLVTPITLAPGNYAVSGGNTLDPIVLLSSYSTAPQITYIDGAWSDSPTLDFAPGHQPVTWLGANFQYDVLPEPSAATLVLLGTIGATAFRRRR